MLPLSCTLYSEAPSAVARMHSPAGSSGQGRAPASSRRAHGAAEPPAHVAEIARFASVDVFGDAAREHDAVDAAEIGDRIGEVEMLDLVRQRLRREGRDQRVGHRVRDFVHRRGVGDVALASSRSRPRPAWYRPAGSSRTISPPSSTTCSRPPICTAAVAITRPPSTSAELGGAAADIDVEDALALVVRHPRGARAVGGQHRFHVMAGGGADELAALLGEDAGDRLARSRGAALRR